MGQIVVNSHLGDGQYDVTIKFDNAAIEARQTFITNRLQDIDQLILDILPLLQEAAFQVEQVYQLLNEYINATTPENVESNSKYINSLTKEGLEKKAQYDSLKRKENLYKLEKTALTKEQSYLSKYCPSEINTQAWCVAYKKDLTGSIKSIEVDYALERDVLTNQIRSAGIWLPESASAPTDILRHPMAGSVHSTWFDLAMAPAAQRYKGRYRVATINALDKDNDTANITFEGRYSVSDNLSNVLDQQPIHPQVTDGQQQNYTGASVQYMTCNARAFEVGDKVIVDLHEGFSAPTVIGFFSNPRPCRNFQGWTIPIGIGNEPTWVNGQWLGFPSLGMGYLEFTLLGYANLTLQVNTDIPLGNPILPGQLVRQTNGPASINISTTITKSYPYAGRTLTYTQVITFTGNNSLDYSYVYTNQTSITGSGARSVSIETSLKIDGVEYGVVHSASYSSTSSYNYTTATGLTKTVNSSYSMTSKSLGLFDDDTVEGQINYTVSGSNNYVVHDLETTSQSGQQSASRYVSGLSFDIHQTRDYSLSKNDWANVAAYEDIVGWYVSWPSQINNTSSTTPIYSSTS